MYSLLYRHSLHFKVNREDIYRHNVTLRNRRKRTSTWVPEYIYIINNNRQWGRKEIAKKKYIFKKNFFWQPLSRRGGAGCSAHAQSHRHASQHTVIWAGISTTLYLFLPKNECFFVYHWTYRLYLGGEKSRRKFGCIYLFIFLREHRSSRYVLCAHSFSIACIAANLTS